MDAFDILKKKKIIYYFYVSTTKSYFCNHQRIDYEQKKKKTHNQFSKAFTNTILISLSIDDDAYK